MKNILAIILITFSFSTSFANKNQTFVGRFRFPEGSEIKDFCLYFNGTCIQVENRTFIFRADQPLNSVNLLITDFANVHYKVDPESQTPVFFVKEDSPYGFLILNKISPEPGTFNWQVLQGRLQGSAVPLNTLILFLDIQQIGLRIEANPWKSSFNGMKLPEIIIEGNSEVVKSQLLKNCLSQLDLKVFHSKPKTKQVESDNLCLIGYKN